MRKKGGFRDVLRRPEISKSCETIPRFRVLIKRRLWKYHEALRVREARAQGKEEGRAEAWQEAERWMGGSPPIPGVDPIPAVPGAVLHQTPMTGPLYLQSPQLQSPTTNLFQPQTQNVQAHPSRQQQQQQQQQPITPAQLPCKASPSC